MLRAIGHIFLWGLFSLPVMHSASIAMASEVPHSEEQVDLLLEEDELDVKLLVESSVVSERESYLTQRRASLDWRWARLFWFGLRIVNRLGTTVPALRQSVRFVSCLKSPPNGKVSEWRYDFNNPRALDTMECTSTAHEDEKHPPS